MDLKKEISHTGFVTNIEQKGINVNIKVIAGCSDCQIKGNCIMVEQANKELFIECNPSHFKTGQMVEVRLKSSPGGNIFFLNYFLPFIVLLSVMVTSSAFIKNETTLGLFSLGSLLPYYFILYLFRKKIKKKIRYHVTPLDI